MNSDYFVVRGDTAEEAIKKIKGYKKEELVCLIFNNRLNDFVSRYSDADEGEKSVGGKRIPYIGWFWRATDWYNKRICIGDCGDFIGIMENNKWGYRERLLTEDEVDKVLKIVWDAKILSEKGGCISDIEKNTKDKLNELWDLFQSFKI